VETLPGGYKTYRQRVISDLETLPQKVRFQVICGATGSAKSRLLEALAQEGAQVLDLEALAKHKGSVLGGLPGEAQPSQRWFESQIWNTLSSFNEYAPIWVESESRKIGSLQVPTALLTRIRASAPLRLEASIDARVSFLLDDYGYALRNPAWLKDRLLKLIEIQSRETVTRWCGMVDSAQWESLVKELLVQHYDPLYQRSMQRSYPGLEQAPVIHCAQLDKSSIEAIARKLSSDTHALTSHANLGQSLAT
jgi:tRNA 2-selenouridine synthase